MERNGLWWGDGGRTCVVPWGVAAILILIGYLSATMQPAAADDALEARQLVERAQLTIESFAADANMGAVRDLLSKARGVFIAPQVLRGAFVIGASGGSGVFLARDDKARQWSEPAFYTVGGVSFGLQAGGEASEVVLLVMSERGVSALQGSNIKLGADASIAVGPVGAGVAGATAALSADIISFSRAKGLYGGISLDGSVVAVRDSWNSAYYGKSVTPTDILVRRTVSNPQSASLIAAVAKVSSPR
ncbi:MAG TPA: lipid-binding SYLF domain-containing protein [Candidatus Tectomicrobia bacterium]|nr:lipid-binding SYLF domain-containing protein [Candidatus Tectomicrobia bacterium]